MVNYLIGKKFKNKYNDLNKVIIRDINDDLILIEYISNSGIGNITPHCPYITWVEINSFFDWFEFENEIERVLYGK